MRVITVISVIGVTAAEAALLLAHSHIDLLRAMDDGITNWPQLLDRLKKQPHVMADAPFLYGEVLASQGARASGALLKGVIPEYENQVSELLKSIKFGTAAPL